MDERQLRLPGDPHGIQEPHDVLAADEFAMPSHGDYGLHLPRDPHGIEEPHDVLAAEEFGFPAGPDRVALAMKSGGSLNRVVVLAAAAFGYFLIRRFRR